MNDKLQKRIRQFEDEEAEEHLSKHLAEHERNDRDRAMMLIGGFNAASKIARVIDSEIMRGLEMFQTQQIYLSLGFDTMVEYLNSDLSPLTKPQYYERKALLEKEGDQLFDAFTGMGLSARRRKLLGKGTVILDGDKVIVTQDDQQTEIELTDRTRILETLTALADANAEKSIKIERRDRTIEQQKGTIQNAHDDLDRERAKKVGEIAANPHMVARIELGIAFRKLGEAAVNLLTVEREHLRDAVFEDVARWSADLRLDYRGDVESPREREAPALVGDTFKDALENFLEGVDLDAGDNDSELADQL